MGGTRQWDSSEDADTGPQEDDSAAVLRTIGRVIKKWRERAGLTQTELGEAIGYGMEQVSSVERGRRAPRPEFLTAADEVLCAGGMITELQGEAERARYPKKARDVADLEAKALEMGSYENALVDGLLQTEDYARALYAARRPPYSEEALERHVAARLSRQSIISSGPLPVFTFVQEEVTLRRPIGGRHVMRRQLEHILEMAQLRHIDVQVMPTDREGHAGLAGSFRLLRMQDGSSVGITEVQVFNRVISNPKEIHLLDMRYGMIRAQALTPEDSQAFIKKMLGEA